MYHRLTRLFCCYVDHLFSMDKFTAVSCHPL
uniref:Uncharacterized protein n=1 Tax=Musa acuminata subsp. malaccensis TaxID=214687 RepID=A0A804K034_MUSAM